MGLMRLLPRRYPMRSLEPLPQPFFVFGSGRNGSTMLNLMLNQHPDIFLPSEQYFLGNTIIKFQLYNWMIWRDLGKILAGELLPGLGSHWWEQDMQDVYAEIVLTPSEKVSLEKMVYMIYSRYAEKLGRNFSVWGDSTNTNIYYAKEIFSLYPQSKYVFLLRDARDVVASYKKGGADHFARLFDPKESAKYWFESVRCYNWLLGKGAQLHLVKYEQLVEDPKTVLNGLMDYLGLDFYEGILKFNERVPTDKFYLPPQHQNLKNPLNNRSIGKWKDVLDEKDLKTIMPIVGDDLRRFGYL